MLVFTYFLCLGYLGIFSLLLTHSTQVKFDHFFSVEVDSSSDHIDFED